MKRKIAIAMLSAAIACCSAVGLAACVTDSGDTSEPFWTIETAYAEAQDLGYGGTLEEFLAQIQGEDGKDGQDGQDGIGIADIFVDENGMLYVTLSDGGQIECGNVRGEQGAPGVGITGAEIDIDGNLILYLSTGEPINCGKVVGSNGQDGLGILNAYVDETGQLTIEYTDGSITNVGAVVGEPGQDGQNGQDGQDGVGIQDINIVNDRLVITLTNNTRLNLGNIKGDNGEDGKDGDSISGAFINENGELVLNFTSGNNINVGNVVGSDGTDISNITIDENNNLIIYLSNGGYFNLGNIKGQDGADGADGVGIQNIAINEFGELVITLTNNNVLNLGNVMGANGQDGADGVGIHHIDIVNGNLIVTLTNDVEFDLGNIMGTDGTNGEDGDSVSSAYINENGELVLTFVSGKQITVGNVVGADGQNGASITAAQIDSQGHLILTFNYGHTLDCGNVMGTDGVGIRDIAFNESGELIITMTDDSTINCGKIPVCVHQYSVWNTVLEPTCTSIGYETRTCSICNNVEYNFFEKLGHCSTEYSYNQSVHSFVCDRCDLYIQESHSLNKNNECVCGYVLDYSLGLQYELNDDKNSYSVVGIGTYTGIEPVVPSTHKNLPVTSIGKRAFASTKIKSINLPDTITIINDEAFFGCYSLSKIAIPNNVTHIGSWAFSVADICSLTEIIIPKSVSNIGEFSFRGQACLTIYCEATQQPSGWSNNWNGDCTIIWNCNNNDTDADGYSYVVIDNIRYRLKDGIASVIRQSSSLSGYFTIPSTINYNGENFEVISVSDYAFSMNLFYLKGITLPNTIISIGDSAFSCPNIEYIVLPSFATNIGQSAFHGCENIKSLIIPDGITSIHYATFMGCNSLHEILLPGSIEQINSEAFKNCTSLEVVYFLGEALKWEGIYIGAENEALTNATIYYYSETQPTKEGTYWHYADDGITPVIWDTESGDGDTEDDFYIATIDGIEYWLEGGTAIVLNNQRMLEGDIVIPTTVTYNGKNYSVTEISAQAFQSCYDITSITLPEGLITIGDSAFAYCLGITSINIPSSVTSIGNNIFTGCELLSDIFVSADNNTYCDEDGILFNIDKTILMCYPAGKTATEYAIPDSVTGIADNAFNRCISLKSITFSENGQLTTIGNYSFQGCTGLTDITIPNGVNTIGQSAFEDCTSLTNITLPNSVTEIGGHAFSHCNFTSIVLPKGIETIQYNLFSYCSSLENIIIPEGVTSIGAYAFEGCENLVSIILPDSLTTIDRVAFYECTGLTSITLPKNVTTIGDYAFLNCNNLESVYYEGTSEEWASISIGTNNDPLTNATVYYYSEAEPVEEGNYWHYVDGVVTIW